MEALNRYFKELASHEVRRKTAAVFVLREEGQARVSGYYSFSQCLVQLADLPEQLSKKLPHYPQAPATAWTDGS